MAANNVTLVIRLMAKDDRLVHQPQGPHALTIANLHRKLCKPATGADKSVWNKSQCLLFRFNGLACLTH